MRALIVDDSKPVRSILAKMLGDLGYACEQAADGAEALAILARSGRPDVVTVNLHMPVMNGFALIERIRGQALLKSLPIVAMSSDRAPEVVDRAIRAGAGVFVAKPSLRQRSARPSPPSAPELFPAPVPLSATRRCGFSSSMIRRRSVASSRRRSRPIRS